ncbi:MAG: CPBP family intramembrane metalloprotease [Sedimentisphaerales bacterium]|nr:CPBP family intramembrane metalloprotease [Sedimentisphaerales bacterium]
MFDGKESIDFAEFITADRVVCAAGLLLLARWLLTTSLGRTALADSPTRRNNMPPYVPLIPLFIWFGPVPLISLIAHKFLTDLPAWQGAFVDNCIFGAGAVMTIGIILFLARIYFARRLKGFGLNVKTTLRDLAASFVNLLAVWPLVMAAMILTVSLIELFSSQDYQMERHQELKLIVEHPQLPLRLLIVIVSVLITPVMEELLFRGLFQTALRSFFETISEPGRIPPSRIWLAIVLCSALFAFMHANPSHFPALFVLGVAMGYAYEKSGSLLRSIFIHAMFNATSIVANLS